MKAHLPHFLLLAFAFPVALPVSRCSYSFAHVDMRKRSDRPACRHARPLPYASQLCLSFFSISYLQLSRFLFPFLCLFVPLLSRMSTCAKGATTAHVDMRDHCLVLLSCFFISFPFLTFSFCVSCCHSDLHSHSYGIFKCAFIFR